MNEQKWITHTQAANKAFHANQPGIAVVHYVSALNTAQRQIQLAQVNGAKQAVGMLLMSYHNLAEFWSTRHDSTQQKFYLQQAYDQLLELVKASLIPQEVRRQAYIGLNQAYQSMGASEQFHFDSARGCKASVQGRLRSEMTSPFQEV